MQNLHLFHYFGLHLTLECTYKHFKTKFLSFKRLKNTVTEKTKNFNFWIYGTTQYFEIDTCAKTMMCLA